MLHTDAIYRRFFLDNDRTRGKPRILNYSVIVTRLKPLFCQIIFRLEMVFIRDDFY